MKLYPELLSELGDDRVIEIRTIVSDDSLWHTIPIDQVMPGKLRHNVLGNGSKGGSLNPFREVINIYQDKAMPIGSGRPDFSDHVNVPH